MSERQRTLVDLAVKLTETPHAVEERDISRLKKQGFGDGAIHDLATIIAYFNFVNRTASGLGVELEPDARTEGRKSGA
jgi:uncharacterized peroxidase-related enzyme